MSKTKLNFADVFADLGKGELLLLQLVESKVASDNNPLSFFLIFGAKKLKITTLFIQMRISS